MRDLHFEDFFEFGITDMKLVRIEIFKYNTLKEHISVYISDNFKFLGAIVFTLEVCKFNCFYGFF